MGGSFDNPRSCKSASIKLVFPLPFGPTTRLKGPSCTCASRNALKFRNATDAITTSTWDAPHGRQCRWCSSGNAFPDGSQYSRGPETNASRVPNRASHPNQIWSAAARPPCYSGHSTRSKTFESQGYCPLHSAPQFSAGQVVKPASPKRRRAAALHSRPGHTQARAPRTVLMPALTTVASPALPPSTLYDRRLASLRPQPARA
jgi:hypothetical protein